MASLPRLLCLRASHAWRLPRGRGRRARVLAAAVGGGIAVLLFAVSFRLFTTLRLESSGALADALVRAALHASFLFALLRDAVGVPGHLLRARDGALYATAPLPGRRVLGLRLFEALAEAAGPALQFSAPWILGYAAASARPANALAAGFVSLVLLVLLSVGAVATLTILAPERWSASARRRRWLLAGAAAVGVGGTLLFVARPLESPGAWAPSAATALATALDALLPSGWAARVLLDAAQGEAASAVPWGGLLLLVLLLVGCALWRLGDRWEVAWRRAAEVDATRRRRRSRASAFAWVIPIRNAGLRLAALLPTRDTRLLLREPGMVLDLLFVAFLIGVLPLLFGRSDAQGANIPWRVVAGLVGVEIAYEIASRSLLLERRATHWVRNAPVVGVFDACARVASGAVAGAVAAGICGAIAVPFPREPSPGAAAVTGALVLAAASLGWAASRSFGEPDWRHPRQMLRLPGRLLLLATVVFAGWGLVVATEPSRGSYPPGPASHVVDRIWIAVAGLAVALGGILWGAHARREEL